MTIATTRNRRDLAAFFEDGYHVWVEPNHMRFAYTATRRCRHTNGAILSRRTTFP